MACLQGDTILQPELLEDDTLLELGSNLCEKVQLERRVCENSIDADIVHEDLSCFSDETFVEELHAWKLSDP